MEPQTQTIGPTTGLSAAQKWYALVVCAVAALLIRYAGQLALWPRDIGLPVSLLTCRWPLLATVEMAAVCAAGAALVSALVGRWLPGVGTAAVGAGLVVLGWSDADWRLVAAYVEARSPSWDAWNARFLLESFGWGLCIACAVAAERLTRRWMGVDKPEVDAGAEYSPVSGLIRNVVRSREQWAMWLAAGLGGVILVDVLYTRSVAAPMGQGFFIATVSMLLGVLLGHQVFAVKGVWPAALGWLVPAAGGAIWAMAADGRDTWYLTGINPLSNMLPIQYAAGGTFGGVLGLWSSYRLTAWRQEQIGS